MSPDGGVPLGDLRKIFLGCQRMANVPNAVDYVPENFDRLSRMHERYRQTKDRQTNGRQHSELEREFTFAKIVTWFGVGLIIGRSR